MNTHEMQGPNMMNQIQEYLKQNPEQYKHFQKIQETLKMKEDQDNYNSLSPKEKIKLTRQKLSSQRHTKHIKEVIETKEQQKLEKSEQEQKIKEQEEHDKQKDKLERLKCKNQRKYSKKREKKKNKQLLNEFEVIE